MSISELQNINVTSKVSRATSTLSNYKEVNSSFQSILQNLAVPEVEIMENIDLKKNTKKNSIAAKEIIEKKLSDSDLTVKYDLEIEEFLKSNHCDIQKDDEQKTVIIQPAFSLLVAQHIITGLQCITSSLEDCLDSLESDANQLMDAIYSHKNDISVLLSNDNEDDFNSDNENEKTLDILRYIASMPPSSNEIEITPIQETPLKATSTPLANSKKRNSTKNKK